MNELCADMDYCPYLGEEPVQPLVPGLIGALVHGEKYEVPVTLPTKISLEPETRNTIFAAVAGLGVITLAAVALARK